MNPSLNLVEDFDDAVEFMAWLSRDRRILAIDTETSGLAFWSDRLRLVQFGDTETGWAVPWEQWGGLVKDALRRYTGPIVMHNAKFDERFLRLAGAPIDRARIHDTRPMAHLLDPVNSTGLKSLGVRYVDNKIATGQDDLKRDMAKYKWTWGTVPVDAPSFWVYSALDAVITACLHEQLWPHVRAKYESVYDLEIATQWVISDLEARGARIDLAYCEQKYEALSLYVEQMADYIKAEHDCGVSDGAVSARLLADGVILTKRTDTGRWCMDKEVLSGIDHPLAAATLARKKAQKISNTYFRGFLASADGDRLHCDVNPMAARTGRMSVKNPALQTLPRGAIVRQAFIASEGGKLVDIDYDQVEQRLVASFSKDAGMVAAFAEADAGGADFFTSLARRIYGDPSLVKDDPRRQTTKNAAYAKAYGAGAETFAHTAGIPVVAAQQFLDMYDATFPGMKRWQREVEAVGRERLGLEGEAYVNTAWGRRLPTEDDKLYTLANYLIQGTASDLLKQKLVDLDSAGLSCYIVLPVHDELLFDVPEDDVAQVAPELVAVMNETERFQVPLTCGADIGNTWAEVHG